VKEPAGKDTRGTKEKHQVAVCWGIREGLRPTLGVRTSWDAGGKTEGNGSSLKGEGSMGPCGDGSPKENLGFENCAKVDTDRERGGV